MTNVGDATCPRTVQPGTDPLRQRRLARAQVAGEHHEVARPQHVRERATVRPGRVGVGKPNRDAHRATASLSTCTRGTRAPIRVTIS